MNLYERITGLLVLLHLSPVCCLTVSLSHVPGSKKKTREQQEYRLKWPPVAWCLMSRSKVLQLLKVKAEERFQQAYRGLYSF